jgi:hypothetical protein
MLTASINNELDRQIVHSLNHFILNQTQIYEESQSRYVTFRDSPFRSISMLSISIHGDPGFSRCKDSDHTKLNNLKKVDDFQNYLYPDKLQRMYDINQFTSQWIYIQIHFSMFA